MLGFETKKSMIILLSFEKKKKNTNVWRNLTRSFVDVHSVQIVLLSYLDYLHASEANGRMPMGFVRYTHCFSGATAYTKLCTHECNECVPALCARVLVNECNELTCTFVCVHEWNECNAPLVASHKNRAWSEYSPLQQISSSEKRILLWCFILVYLKLQLYTVL